MFNRMFQSIIHQMKDAIGSVIGILDKNGIIVACSDLQRIGEVRQSVQDELAFHPDSAVVIGGVTYRSLVTGEKGDLAVFVEGTDAQAAQAVGILAISLGNMKSLYDQKYDKASFIKNVMLDNILPSDIYVKSKELHFGGEENRVVMVIKFQGRGENLPYEIISGMFPDSTHDYVINMGEQDVVLVKEVEEDTPLKDLEAVGEEIVATLTSENYTNVYVGISSIVNNVKDLALAYKEARVAL